MSTPAQLRAARMHFGLQQHALADWLGISRVQLAHAEADLDPCPTPLAPGCGPG